jgi:hypothetical protein
MKNYPLVVVSFLDHTMCTGDNMEPAKCEVVGWLVKQDKKCLYLITWSCDNIINSQDTEAFVIVKHPGLKVRNVR